MFTRFIGAVERQARWVLVAWVGAAVVLTLVAPSLNDVGSQDTTDFLPHDAPSQQADRLLAKLFPGDPTRDASVIVVAREGGLTEVDRAYLADLTTWLEGPANSGDVRTVQSASTNPDLAAFLRSVDGDAELLVTSMVRAPLSVEGAGVVQRIRDHMDKTAPDGLAHHLTGIGGLGADQIEGVVQSFDRTAIVTVILVLAILLLIYRSVVAALIPLVSIGLAFLVAQGCVNYAAQAGLKVNTLVGTFIIVMIFGAGTDYCLFLTSRYREDLAAGDSVAITVRRTTKVIGAVIAASAGTVIVGFGSMITADFGIFKTMGPAIAIAIAVTLLAGLTLTPALLKLTGDKAFWPRTLDTIRATTDESSPRWQRLATIVRQHPAEVLLAGIIVLQIPTAGLAGYQPSFDLVRDLPTAADARVGFGTVSDHYPGGTISPVYLLIRADGPILDDGRLAAIDQLTDALRGQAGIAEVRSVTQPAGAPLTPANIGTLTGGITDPAALGFDPATTDLTPLLNGLNAPGGVRLTGPLLAQYPQLTQRLGLLLGADGNSTRLIVALSGNPYDRHALDAIRRIDDTAGAALAGTALSGARIDVGGPSAFYADMRQISNDDFRVLLAVIIGAIFVVLALLLQSLVAPFYLLASVILSYVATMGITVVVFQGILGDPGITFWLGPFLFVVLVALGADYNIFIMSRIREEADAGHEIHVAVTRGITLTGRVITSAGIILAGTFAALLLAPLPNLRQIGFGICLGILIDTFIVRSLIVPAATMLLGRWAFWPRIPTALGVTREPVRRRHIGLAGAGVAILATLLLAIALTGGGAPPVTVVAAAAAPLPATSATTATTVAPAAGTPDGATTTVPPTADPARNATGTQSGAAAPMHAPNGPGGPTRISVPATGTWTYHVTGSRRLAGGSPEPIDENSPTEVSRTGGTDDSPELRLYTSSSTFTRDDTRRFGPGGVELLATTFTASGATFGGTLQPPQLLARWPLVVGDSWSGTSTAGTMTITGTGRVVGERDLTTQAGTFHCWDVQLDATITGDVKGEQHETSCWVPELGMPVETTQQMSGTYNGIPFEVNLASALLTTP
jgi:RND superfamily putative drug exporter